MIKFWRLTFFMCVIGENYLFIEVRFPESNPDKAKNHTSYIFLYLKNYGCFFETNYTFLHILYLTRMILYLFMQTKFPKIL